MINLRKSLAILVCRMFVWAMRILGSGGTSLPGKVALKICPTLPEMLAPQFRIYMITGTNGKTTTARMVARLLEDAGIAYMTNKSGANLASGITATIASACTLSGMRKVDTLLLEADEAAFRVMAPKIKPHTVLVTNFFRDQLDRYGELYSTLNGVKEGLSKSPNTIIVLNADDSLCASISTGLSNQVFAFGLSPQVMQPAPDAGSSDAAFCIRCSSRYVYNAYSYGHLGDFSCPSCGFSRPETIVTCDRIMMEGSASSTISITTDTAKYVANINIPGRYNIYNALAAATFAETLGLAHETVIKALANFECGFGRMESIEADGKEIKVILVKNPTGFNQVLQFMRTDTSGSVVAFLINDLLADGTDISWLWDVDFELLASNQQQFKRFYTSGLRAEDMAVRLKYAGIYKDSIFLEHDMKELLMKAMQQVDRGGSLYLLPTYTAMLTLRKLLKKQYKLRAFWK